MRTIRLLTTVACLAPWTLPASANDEVQKLIQDPNQWAIQTGDYANTRYSKLDQINAGNVSKLQAAWTFSTGVLRGHEGAPLVIGDVMYVHTPFPNIVYALDLNNDGKIIWKYEPKQDPTVIPVMCCDTVHRGVAYADGKIFLHQADTTLVALDAKTGKVVWSKVNGDPKKGETNTATVLPVKDKIIVGISGGEFGVRCHVTAYDMKDGRQVWRAYSMGPDNEMLIDPDKTMEHGKPVGKDSSIKTWQGEQWKTGGGCTWGWYSYDPAQNAFYYGSGNPSTWNPKQRPGDNKWTMTIFSRDVDTGVAKWVYQMTPHDEWDYDGVNEMILADQDVKGQRRPILVHFDRNGFGYTLDRVTGELLVAEKYDPTVNWASKVDMDKASKTYGRPLVVPQFSTEHNGEDVNSKGICPAALGSKDQQPAAFSPKTGLFYVPTNHVCMDYEPFRVRYTPGQPYVGATLSMYPATNSHGGMGNFIAWDAREGKIVWSLKEQFSVWSGALATAGDVVFYGTLEGYLKAVDSKTGKELYKFKNSVRHHRKRDDVHPQGQAVRRRPLRHRRLGRHRPCGGSHRTDRRSRSSRRLRGSQQLHRARRPADGIHASAVILPSLSHSFKRSQRIRALAFCVAGHSVIEAGDSRRAIWRTSLVVHHPQTCFRRRRTATRLVPRRSDKSRRRRAGEAGPGRSRPVFRRRGRSDLGRDGRLGDLFGLPALSRRMPRLPRPGRRRLELCPGARRLAEDHEARRVRGDHGAGPPGPRRRAAERDALVRHEQQRDVLSRRHLRLSARAGRWRPASDPARQARRQAAGGEGRGEDLPWRVEQPPPRRAPRAPFVMLQAHAPAASLQSARV